MATQASYQVELDDGNGEKYDDSAQNGESGAADGNSGPAAYSEEEAVISAEEGGDSAANPNKDNADASKNSINEVTDLSSMYGTRIYDLHRNIRFVSNIGLDTTPPELVEIFSSCGELGRATIICDARGQSKG